MDKEKELKEKGYIRESKYTLEEQMNLLRGSPESNSPVKKSPKKSNSPGVTNVLVVDRENAKEEYVIVDTIKCRSSKLYPSPNEYASNQVLIPDDEKKVTSPGNLSSGGINIKMDTSSAKKTLFGDDKDSEASSTPMEASTEASNTPMEASTEASNTPMEASMEQRKEEKPKNPLNEPKKIYAELKPVPITECKVFSELFSLNKKGTATGMQIDQGAASMGLLHTDTSGTILNLNQPLSMDWNVNLINLDTNLGSGTDNSQAVNLSEMYQYKCPYCSESFWKEDDFRQHCRKEHVDMK